MSENHIAKISATTTENTQASNSRNFWLIFETIGLASIVSFSGLKAVTIVDEILRLPLLALIIMSQALLLYRLYIIGHESAHQKLIKKNLFLNNLIGQIVLLPTLFPLRIYRKVHLFHHSYNRKNEHTSAMDIFVSPWPLNKLVKTYYYTLWYLGVFAGGYFIHSIVSVVIFLFFPIKVAREISPAFKDWAMKDRLISWIQLFSGLSFHLIAYHLLGLLNYLIIVGIPYLCFAWIWSLLFYIYHYRTSIGHQTSHNVRSLKSTPFFSWLLLNGGEHATHHMKPSIPWHQLPSGGNKIPHKIQKSNRMNLSFWKTILWQLKGPTIIYKKDRSPLNELFSHWED